MKKINNYLSKFNKYMIFTIGFSIINIYIYIMMGFINWELNPIKWLGGETPMEIRILILIYLLITIGLASLYTIFIKESNKLK